MNDKCFLVVNQFGHVSIETQTEQGVKAVLVNYALTVEDALRQAAVVLNRPLALALE